MRLKGAQITKFQRHIFDWWKDNRRDLPWRRTHDPYKILVSEVMLQQTQVSRVIEMYVQFLERFPTVYDLATASAGDVLRMWKGLGYNRRALYLKKTAERVVEVYNGVFPTEIDQLRSLPGIGKYTAGAIVVFAYKKHACPVDTNIRRIIQHFFFRGVSQTDQQVEEVASQLVPEGKAWEWHQALMDYGALALPRNTYTKKHIAKPRVPFIDTKRYVRGRVLDMLRGCAYNQDELITYLTETHNKERGYYVAILRDLVKEGLVSLSQNTYMLPL